MPSLRDSANSYATNPRVRSTSELGLYQFRDLAHVGTTDDLRLDQANHLAHVAGAARAGICDGRAHDLVKLVCRECRRQICLDDFDFRPLDSSKILSIGSGILLDRIATLL